MFRFWGSDSRGSEKTVPSALPMLDFAKPQQPCLSPDSASSSFATQSPGESARPRPTKAAIASQHGALSPALKRSSTSDDEEGHPVDDNPRPQKKVASSDVKGKKAAKPGDLSAADTETLRDVLDQQFSLEILLKHGELRLIDQELAKCQVALEQLRRCHLIPYPQNVPTPQQMLDITLGKGPALQPKSGEKLPQWAPPFGVTDGPYARHYAKWLIPDPKFDGIPFQPLAHSDQSRLRTSVDGRSTRNSHMELNTSQNKGRPVRGNAGQKLQALSNGYPVPKDKNGPCTLKRSDGKTVKLVCIDCHRENFSSTQGFINHCRIAHKRDFKSHEEAAVHCGHPIDVPESGSGNGSGSGSGNGSGSGSMATGERPVSHPPLPSGLVHPFARPNAMSDSEACFSVVRRIEESMKLYREGNLPGVTSIPTATATATANANANATPGVAVSRAPASASIRDDIRPWFRPAKESPQLSRLLEERGFSGDFCAMVSEAKKMVVPDEYFSPDEEPEESDTGMPGLANGARTAQAASSNTPRMRVPARATMSPAVSTARPVSSKGMPPVAPYATPIPTPAPQTGSGSEAEMVMDADMLDRADLSPNTAISNNAPSLVSDDGEYDDSVADSDPESEGDDGIRPHSMSDVDDLEMEDDHNGGRAIRHHRGSSGVGPGTTVRLGRDDSKNVGFMNTVRAKNSGKQKRKRGMADAEAR
ncbi:hypothetical protein F4780DRAFT_773717 [Xylariomycetidae sp. FL0641]|nr:hypothetical protein F4780DRAFT_773717 [Xylariomycetidae sp. FL0641]